MNKQFLSDVEKGLSSEPKFLSSRYFYDKVGDKLFVDIMNMPEYYLTDSEHEIFIEQHHEIIKALEVNKGTYFELIELGAGDGTKTKALLRELTERNFTFDYMPVDISEYALSDLKNSLKVELPSLSVETKQGDYFEVLESLKDSHHPKVVLFLGSNIGNLLDHEAHDFLYKLGSNISPGDKILLGVDLIKSADIVLPAYNDSQKITARFNLNLLTRMNRELGADFAIDGFQHSPEYTEEEGIARSFLESTEDQSITIKALNKSIHFSKGERIHTEISRKYNDTVLADILKNTDFEIKQKFMDSKSYFADYILNRK